MSDTSIALSLGGITFLLTVIWGGPLVQVLRMLKIGKQIRIEGHGCRDRQSGHLTGYAAIRVSDHRQVISRLGQLHVG